MAPALRLTKSKARAHWRCPVTSVCRTRLAGFCCTRSARRWRKSSKAVSWAAARARWRKWMERISAGKSARPIWLKTAVIATRWRTSLASASRLSLCASATAIPSPPCSSPKVQRWRGSCRACPRAHSSTPMKRQVGTTLPANTKCAASIIRKHIQPPMLVPTVIEALAGLFVLRGVRHIAALITVRRSLPWHFGNGLLRRPPTSNQAARSRTAVAKASTESCGTNCSTARSSTPSRRPKS